MSKGIQMITRACKFYRASSSFWGVVAFATWIRFPTNPFFLDWSHVCECYSVFVCSALFRINTCMHAWLPSLALCLRVIIFKGDVWLLWLYSTGRTEVAGLAAPQMTQYLAGEEAAHTDDAEDVKDGRAHDGPHPHVTFGNKHPWEENNTHTHTHRIIPRRSG